MNALELKVPPLALTVAFALAMWLAAARRMPPAGLFELPAHRVIAALARRPRVAGWCWSPASASAAPGPR
jgi:hypothetical protein